MVYMRHWLHLLGEKSQLFSSHSLRRGTTTTVHKAQISDTDIQRLGNWKSMCYRRYIEEDIDTKVSVRAKFNKFLNLQEETTDTRSLRHLPPTHPDSAIKATQALFYCHPLMSGTFRCKVTAYLTCNIRGRNMWHRSSKQCSKELGSPITCKFQPKTLQSSETTLQ